jgi:pheromone shutdown protein TraB
MKQEQGQTQGQRQTLVKIDFSEYLKNPYIKVLIIATVVLTVVSVVGTIYMVVTLSSSL